VLFVVLALLLQFPPVQTMVSRRVVHELSSRTGAYMSLEKISIRLPSGLAIKEFYAEDARGDTLLWAGRVKVDMKPLALLRQRIKVSKITLDDITANIIRLEPDTVFSYDFILQALAGDQPTGEPEIQELEKKPSPWTFELGKLEINRANVRFADHFSGIDLLTDVGSLTTRIEHFKPDSFRYHLGKTRIGDTRIILSLNEPSRPSEEKDSTSTIMDLALKALEVGNFSFTMNTWEGFALQTRIGELEILSRRLDIPGQNIELERLAANGLLVDLTLPSKGKRKESPAIEGEGNKDFRWADTFAWHIVTDALELRNADIALASRGESFGGPGFDAANFRFTDMDLVASDLDVSPEAIKLELENLKALSGNDFSLHRLAADIDLGNTLRIDGLKLETALSLLEGNVYAGISPLEFPIRALGAVPIEAEISQGRLGRDLAWFFPKIREKLEPSDRLLFGLEASGRLDDLRLDTLWVEGPGTFRLETSGRVAHLLEKENLEADIPRIWLTANLDKLKRFLPTNTLPANLALPDSFDIVASMDGSVKEMLAKADLRSNFGDLGLQGTFTDLLSDNLGYDAVLEVTGFELGSLLRKEDLLGAVSARMDVVGKGLDPETMEAVIDLLVSEAYVKRYTYRDLAVNGSVKEGLADLGLEYFDDQLGLTAENQLSLALDTPMVEARWDISHMNLRGLNLMEEETILRAALVADLKLTHDDFAEGMIRLSQLQVRTAEDLFSLDELGVTTAYVDSIYEIKATSPIVRGQYRGKVSPLDVPGLIKAHLASLMRSTPDSLATDLGEGFFAFDLEVLPSPWFSELLLPQLSFVDPFQVEGRFDGNQGILVLDAGIPMLEYGKLVFNDFALNVDTRAGVGQFNLELPFLEGEGFQIRNLSVDGQLRDSVLAFNLAFDDREDVRWLDLKGRLRQDSPGMVLSLDEEVLINREPWQVSPGNQIHFGDSLLLADRFRLHNDGQYILVQSRETETGFPPLDIQFHQFELGQFFTFGEEPLAGGVFNGDITLKNLFGGLSFVSDLNIDHFSFRGDTLGDIHIAGSNPAADLYVVEALVKGYGNEIEAEGSFRTGEEAALDLTLRLLEVNLSTMEGFTAGQVSGLEGRLSGSLTATGSPKKPVLKGSLQLQEAEFRAEFLNAPYRIPDGKIVLDENVLRFQSFTLQDSLGRSATLGGKVNLASFSNPGFNLNLSAGNFLLMNVAKGQNELFWGLLFIDSDLSLLGDLNSPRVEGRMKLNEGSNLSFIVPQNTPEAIGDEGVVEFISPRDTLFLGMIDQAAPATVMAPFRNLNLSVNAEIDPETDVTVIIDEYAGDFLEIKGGGVLSYGIDPGGRVSLAGRYEITDGTYLLTFYDVISRRFHIQKGGSILLTGDPMKAQVDITAIYNLRTSPHELFESDIAAAETDPALRQQYPFEVFLTMKGELLNPQISFAIGLPESQQNAMDGRLLSRLTEISQNESELNKQVFALLMLGQFVQENPFASLGAPRGGLSTTARNSASRILSQQLNRISEQYIRGVNLTFDIESYEDFSGGEAAGRTELQVEVSRNFFDERLRLKVGGNIELEDETRRQENAGEIAGDFMLEYLLNPQGSLILRGFRKKEYGDLFDGEVVNTGVSLLFTKNYNRFRELFMKKEKDAVVSEPDEPKKMPEDEE
jgi:hypothetical protein